MLKKILKWFKRKPPTIERLAKDLANCFINDFSRSLTGSRRKLTLKQQIEKDLKEYVKIEKTINE